ncbi:MAG: hypothetical protein ACQETG_06500 [Thermodesulfobacteriota bacterium]
MTENSDNNNNEEILELSDIAIGTSKEDEEIIELTEELVDEARNGISGARLDAGEDSRTLELSGQQGKSGEAEYAGSEQEIARELENYFPINEEQADFIELDEPVSVPAETGQVSFTDQQLEAALERVIERKYRERIETLIEEMIRNRVSEDIESIKDFILNRSTGE